ncbi:hypothetical protein FA10DRAFT_265230 [Acaromyces ingoldii]|uniref:Uncharacterized protein n=1 Tax=Acaromyces ingoldii TaxID=215250 RepID=A0A316YP98_9BASI|nr:hypothetical protein FA10DRAFT_265230 [Acaromyces ingoldii]PWN91370.1 hypothetical protein FA10DRAFT_265230 [Acaromyces ingoldii]
MRAPLSLGPASLAWDESSSSEEEEEEAAPEAPEDSQEAGPDAVEEMAETLADESEREDDSPSFPIPKRRYGSMPNVGEVGFYARGRTLSSGSSSASSMTVPRGGDALPGAKARHVLGLDSDGFELGPGSDWETDDELASYHPKTLVKALKKNGNVMLSKKKRRRQSKALPAPYSPTDYRGDHVPAAEIPPMPRPTHQHQRRPSVGEVFGVRLEGAREAVTNTFKAAGSRRAEAALRYRKASDFKTPDEGYGAKKSSKSRGNEHRVDSAEYKPIRSTPVPNDVQNSTLLAKSAPVERSNISDAALRGWSNVQPDAAAVDFEVIMQGHPAPASAVTGAMPPPRPARSHLRSATVQVPNVPSTSARAVRGLSTASSSTASESQSSWKRRSNASLATFSSAGGQSEASSSRLSPGLSTSSSLTNNGALLTSPGSRSSRNRQQFVNPLLSPVEPPQLDDDDDEEEWQKISDRTSSFVRPPLPFEEPRKAPLPPGSSGACSLMLSTAAALGLHVDDSPDDQPQSHDGSESRNMSALIKRMASKESAILDPMLQSPIELPEEEAEEAEEEQERGGEEGCSILVHLSSGDSHSKQSMEGRDAAQSTTFASSEPHGRDERPMSIPLSPASAMPEYTDGVEDEANAELVGIKYEDDGNTVSAADGQQDKAKVYLEETPLQEGIQYEEDEFSKAIAKMAMDEQLGPFSFHSPSPTSSSFSGASHFPEVTSPVTLKRRRRVVKNSSKLIRRSTDDDDREFINFMRMYSK